MGKKSTTNAAQKQQKTRVTETSNKIVITDTCVTKRNKTKSPKALPVWSASESNGTDETTGEYLKPIYKDGEVILEVECGPNKALLYLTKLCQGSKGPCILYQESWLTPNEFQYVSGRETAKDWKRSIRHHGKSMKLLLAKGFLTVHSSICDCEGCRISSPVVSNRLLF